jgi:hypothetical protein
MGKHDYVSHLADCLREAEAVVHLARQEGQLEPVEEQELARRLEDMSRLIPVDRTGAAD